MSDAAKGAAFWAYALALYQRPAVSAACLRLQDGHGLDVMVLLACLWSASCGRRLGPPELAAMRAAAGPWQARVTRRLRRARHGLAALVPDSAARTAARAAILAAELAAERVTADLLAAALEASALPEAEADSGGGAARAWHNLALYTRCAGADLAAAEADLAVLCTAAFAHA